MGEGEIGGRDYMMVAAAFAESAGALGNMATLRELVSWVNSGTTSLKLFFRERTQRKYAVYEKERF